MKAQVPPSRIWFVMQADHFDGKIIQHPNWPEYFLKTPRSTKREEELFLLEEIANFASGKKGDGRQGRVDVIRASNDTGRVNVRLNIDRNPKRALFEATTSSHYDDGRLVPFLAFVEGNIMPDRLVELSTEFCADNGIKIDPELRDILGEVADKASKRLEQGRDLRGNMFDRVTSAISQVRALGDELR